MVAGHGIDRGWSTIGCRFQKVDGLCRTPDMVVQLNICSQIAGLCQFRKPGHLLDQEKSQGGCYKSFTGENGESVTAVSKARTAFEADQAKN